MSNIKYHHSIENKIDNRYVISTLLILIMISIIFSSLYLTLLAFALDLLYGFLGIIAIIIVIALMFVVRWSEDIRIRVLACIGIAVIVLVGLLFIFPGLLAILTILFMLICIFFPKPVIEELFITDKSITYRKNFSRSMLWSDVKAIIYNEKSIYFFAKGQLTFYFDQNILREIHEVIQLKNLQITVEEHQINLNALIKDFTRVFDKIHFINGVNIFDFYSNIIEEKECPLMTFNTNQTKLENHILRVIQVQGKTIVFDVGIIEFDNSFAIYLPEQEKLKLTEFNANFEEADIKTNISHKIATILKLEEKHTQNQQHIYSENKRLRCLITKRDESYSIDTECLYLPFHYGILGPITYSFELINGGIQADSLNEATEIANKELKRKFHLKANSYLLLMENKANKANFRETEYNFIQCELIFSSLSEDLKEIFSGINKIRVEKLLKEIAYEDRESYIARALSVFLSELKKTMPKLVVNTDFDVLLEVAEYIIEFT